MATRRKTRSKGEVGVEIPGTTTESRVLILLEEMRGEIRVVNEGVSSLRAEVRGQFDEFRREMRRHQEEQSSF